MKHKLITMAVGVVLLLQPVLCPAPAYIKFDGIDGEVTDADHKDWINIESVSVPVHKPGGSASAVFEDIVVVKELDKSSPKLAEAVAKGTNFPRVTIHLLLPAVQGTETRTYMTYTLHDCLISSYSFKSDPDLETLRREHTNESFSLNFEEIKFSYGGIRQTVIRYDENGNEIERVSVGLPTRLGGVVPPEDDIPPGGTSVDSITISANEAEAVETTDEVEVAG